MMKRQVLGTLAGVICVGAMVFWRHTHVSELTRVRAQLQSLEGKLAIADQRPRQTFVLGPSVADDTARGQLRSAGEEAEGTAASDVAPMEELAPEDLAGREQSDADEHFNQLEAAFRADAASSSEESRWELSDALEE